MVHLNPKIVNPDVTGEELLEAYGSLKVDLGKYEHVRTIRSVSHKEAMDVAKCGDDVSVANYRRGLKLDLTHKEIMEAARTYHLHTLFSFMDGGSTSLDEAKEAYMLGFDQKGACSYAAFLRSYTHAEACEVLRRIKSSGTPDLLLFEHYCKQTRNVAEAVRLMPAA